MRFIKNHKMKISLLLTLVLILSMSITAFAETSNIVTGRATSEMTVHVEDGSYAYSNSVDITFSTSNTYGTATAGEVKLPLYQHDGDIVIIIIIIVIAPSGNIYYLSPNEGNTATIDFNQVEPISGTWSVQACCYSPEGGQPYGDAIYYPVSLTLIQ